jgi:hypothetical protein
LAGVLFINFAMKCKEIRMYNEMVAHELWAFNLGVLSEETRNILFVLGTDLTYICSQVVAKQLLIKDTLMASQR